MTTTTTIPSMEFSFEDPRSIARGPGGG